MCKGQAQWQLGSWSKREWKDLSSHLEAFRLDGLLDYNAEGLWVYPEGRPFLRNICMAFDERLQNRSNQTRLFSQTI